MAKVSIKNVNLGGIADSDYLGNENSVAELVGFDIHSEGGVMKVNQALTKESGTTVDDKVSKILPCSDGNTYLFGKTNGKIWKRNSSGTYSLEATASPSAGNAGILDAYEYQGYIYYAMQSRLGRVAVGSPTNWSGRNDSWATFGVTDADFHPMTEVNLVLYIGDGNQVAQVDAGTFSANALDIQEPLRIKSLGKLRTDLLIGTFVNSNIMKTQILRWNTWSVSFSVSDEIPEVGVNAFFDVDNMVLVSAGTKGNIYEYDGYNLVPVKSIKGDFSQGTTNKVTVHQNATLNFHGRPLFGLSQDTGNGAKYGVYSYHRKNINYPRVLALEYISSAGNETDMEYTAIGGIGDIFLVAWYDADADEYGVDKLDLSNKFSGAYFTTRIMTAERMTTLQHGLIQVAYRSLPDGTTITPSVSKNHGSFDNVTSVVDVDRLVEDAEIDIGEATSTQVRIATTASGNDAPEIEQTDINIDTE